MLMPVHLHGSSYACIHFHLVHLPVSHKTQLPCNVLELKCGGLLFDRHKPPLTRRFVVYYCSAVYNTVAKVLQDDPTPCNRAE